MFDFTQRGKVISQETNDILLEKESNEHKIIESELNSIDAQSAENKNGFAKKRTKELIVEDLSRNVNSAAKEKSKKTLQL